MNCLISGILGILVGFSLSIAIFASTYTPKADIALKLSNVMNASMLDCVTQQIITKERVHDIETVFHKHVEENFDFIKAGHGVE